MPSWLLLLVGIGVLVTDLNITYGRIKIDIAYWFRVIVFILCCIYGQRKLTAGNWAGADCEKVVNLFPKK